MKKTILALIALGVLVISIGCDPFGSEKTMTYITGCIYTDLAMTNPAEGVAVELVVNKDSSNVHSQTVFTNASGVFFIAAQFFPTLPDEESGAGYSMPSTAVVGLCAHYGSSSYVYKDIDDGFVVSSGDTLTVWPVSLLEFAGGGL
ncbi:MAG: hypothetical protein K8S62_09380 [Candidatus Sabulitectum sp.]|nr:hypothetical protein [Candidatus Sabulitectum sp.]